MDHCNLIPSPELHLGHVRMVSEGLEDIEGRQERTDNPWLASSTEFDFKCSRYRSRGEMVEDSRLIEA